jgi:hypothetical protein
LVPGVGSSLLPAQLPEDSGWRGLSDPEIDLRGAVVSRLDFPGRLQELDVDLSGQIVAGYPSSKGLTIVETHSEPSNRRMARTFSGFIAARWCR